MEQKREMDIFTYAILFTTTAVLAWVTYLVCKRQDDEVEPGKDQAVEKAKRVKRDSISEAKKAAKAKQRERHNSGGEPKWTHKWLVSRMKGHGGKITDLDRSPNDKFMASAADDRTVFVWLTPDLNEKDHRSIRVNIPFDNATMVRWSPDSKAFIIAREDTKAIEVYKLGRKPDNSIGNITAALRWPQPPSNNNRPYIGLGIACTGKFIMSCTKDGETVLRDVKGVYLKAFYPKVMYPFKAKVSPCGRYVVIAAAEVIEMWEVKFDADGTFKDVFLKWSFNTKLGSIMTDFDLNSDSSKLVSVATEGKWGVFDTTGNRVHCETNGELAKVDDGSLPIASISGDGRVVVIAANKSVYMFSAFTGDMLREITDIYKDEIVCVACSSDSKSLLTAGENIIYVFKNVAWYEETVRILRGQLIDVPENTALWKRLYDELNMYEAELAKF